jgi:predicted ATPase
VQAPLSIRLSGGFRVFKDGTELVLNDKQRIALAYLACSGLGAASTGVIEHKPVLRGSLIAMLWPHVADSSSKRSQLRTLLSEIRASLALPEIEVLETLPNDSVRLAAVVTTDVATALDFLQRALTEPSIPARLRVLLHAIEAWQAPFLPEYSEPEFQIARRWHLDNVCPIIEQVAAVCAGVEGPPPEPARIRSAWERVERIAQVQDVTLMSDAAFVRMHLARIRLALTASEPVRAQQILHTLQEDAGMILQDYEPDLALLRQRIEESANQQHPATRAAHAVASHYSFIGRTAQVEQLRQRLAEHPNLVTLSGPPGVGKTRIAQELCAIMKPEFSAVYMVALQYLTDAQAVPLAILKHMRIAPPARNVLETVVAVLSRSPVLLILDNCEHLLADNGLRDLVAHLIATIPTLTCLATSQSLLGLPAESEWVVPPLPIPPKVVSESALLDCASVRLFVQAARRWRESFRVHSRNAQAVQKLCAALDGLPLALILVASWSDHFTPHGMLEELASLKSRESPTAHDQRYSSLNAAIMLSYSQLPPSLGTLFRTLSVFRSGWTSDAGHAVYGRTADRAATEEALQTLIDRSIVAFEVGEQGVRYTMLETLRTFGDAQLSPQERTAIRRRHSRWFAAMAAQARPALEGPDQAAWLDRLEADHSNLRACLDRLSRTRAKTAALSLCADLQLFWWRRGYLEEGSTRSTAVLARVREDPPTMEQARVLEGAGILARMQGNYGQARALLEQALAMCEMLGKQADSGSIVNTLGTVMRLQGDYPRAEDLLARAVACFRANGNLNGLSIALDNLGNVYADRGDLTQAFRLQTESLAMKRTVGNERSIAEGLVNLARTSKRQGAYGQARNLYEEALPLHTKLGDRQGVARIYISLGNIAEEHGETLLAQTLHTQALEMAQTLGQRQLIAVCLTNLGNLARQTGDSTTARDLFTQSLDLRRELGNIPGIALVLGNLGYLAYEEGEVLLAGRYLRECLQLHTDIGDAEGVTWAWEGCALIALALGNAQAAAYLSGAASASRLRRGAPLPPKEQEWYERRLQPLRAFSGSEELTRWQDEGALFLHDCVSILAIEMTQESGGET